MGALNSRVEQLDTEQKLRNQIIRQALRNRLAVQLDVKIKMREQDYKKAQDVMIDRRTLMIE